MISIIIPVYNMEDYLEQCLSSIICQKKNNIQVIIVDDGSTDDSQIIIKKFCDKFPNIFEYHYKDNGGLSDARNFGVQFVKGEYIWFVDSDDYIDSQALFHISSCIEEYKPDLIIMDYFDLCKDVISSKTILSEDAGFLSKQQYLLSVPCAWNKVINAKKYIESGVSFPLNIWYEDRATTGQYLNFCNSIFYLKKSLYFYRQRSNSIMNQIKYNPKMMDIIKSVNLMHQTISSDKYYDELEYISISNLIYQSGIRLLNFKKYKEIGECISYCNQLYPNWKRNKFFLKRSLIYKLFCYSISKRLYMIARLIMFIYSRL